MSEILNTLNPQERPRIPGQGTCNNTRTCIRDETTLTPNRYSMLVEYEVYTFGSGQFGWGFASPFACFLDVDFALVFIYVLTSCLESLNDVRVRGSSNSAKDMKRMRSSVIA